MPEFPMSSTRSSRPSDTVSVVDRAAEKLRTLALARDNGDFIGSEEELIAHLGVSRPTMRQASALVQQENLITIRRGVGGGFFACKPDTMTVSRIAALYLRAHQAGLAEIIATMRPLRMEIVSLATQCKDPSLLDKLREFLAREAAREGESYRDFLRSERDFGRLLGDLSGNKVITLFLSILYDFAARMQRGDDVLKGRPDRVALYREWRDKMAQAILEGDEEIALVAARRCSDTVAEWIGEDLVGRSFASAAAPKPVPQRRRSKAKAATAT
ncbi:FadR/GntR family transcriptional regulator [Sphingomonas flavalba]|uniref:FadR/GntR family transcriptional regulator n=1 Tax=Sphingomonas flavalba TaxID=2559804 RepID=UPI0039E0347C